MVGNARHILNPQHSLKAANKALEKGMYAECMQIVRGLLDQGLNDPEAQLLAGMAAYLSGDFQQGLSYFLPLLVLVPNYAEVHYFCGNCYLKTGAFDKAIHHFSESSRIDKKYVADAALGIALAHVALKDAVAAKQNFVASLKANPNHTSAWFEFGKFLRSAGFTNEAQKIHSLAAIKDQGFLPTPSLNNAYNLAQYLVFDEQYDEAEKIFQQLLNEIPNEPNCIWSLGQIACLTGDIETGFHLLESRWEIGGGHPTLRDKAFMPQDEYCGQSLAGKTIIVLDEQGLGDFLLFSSCLPDLIAEAKHVIVETPPKLVTLMKRSFPSATIMPVREFKHDPLKRYHFYDWLDQIPAFDYYCGIASLPRSLRKQIKDFTGPSFLIPDEARVEAWRTRLAQLGAWKKVGICYRGGVSHSQRTRSYTEIADWVGALPDGFTYVNLVYDISLAEREMFKEITGHRLNFFEGLNLFDDMENTAALMTALDAVISIASTSAEMAAACGTNTIRITTRPDWTLLGTDQRPWFAQQRILSKKYFDTWFDVMGQISEALRK